MGSFLEATTTRRYKNSTMASNKAISGVDPLKDLLGDVITRLEVLEAKVGVSSSAGGAPKSPVPVKANLIGTLYDALASCGCCFTRLHSRIRTP